MKFTGALLLLFVSIALFSQSGNLRLHYNFHEVTSENIIRDISGNGYDGTLKNHACVDRMGEFSVLNLGHADSYLDMGKNTGEVIRTLQNFSISTYACVNEYADLHANGNFIWAFSNSDAVARDQNGCMFFSAKNIGYAISGTDYRAEAGIKLGKQMPKLRWKHIVYTQQGEQATLYLDGSEVKKGSVIIQPKELGKTSDNFIGRSPYSNDLYFKGLITDFRIYDKALTSEDVSDLASTLDPLNEVYAEYVKLPRKYIADGNPLFTHKFTADPAALIHNDTFYIYAGNDTGDGSGYNMPNWVVFSSADLETWEEHPVPLKTSDFQWAVGNNSWASQVIERNGKFYWYVSTEHGTVRGKAIGVAVSDSPAGPFKDARGTALVTNNMTTKWTGISWDDIDPAVWIDDDGQAYLFWGNTQCYYAKLHDNMIELDGNINPVDLPHFTEAPWIHKKDDWYYLSYASGFPEKIRYAMSKSIEGPWEHKGILNEVSGNCNTNHQAIVEFRGRWYFVYHNGSIQPNGGSYHRSVCMDYLYYNDDNTLKRVRMTTEGVDKLIK